MKLIIIPFLIFRIDTGQATRHSKHSDVSNMGLDVIHSPKVPVIVAEIGAQSVDIQDQSHSAAQQFCKHFSVLETREEN